MVSVLLTESVIVVGLPGGAGGGAVAATRSTLSQGSRSCRPDRGAWLVWAGKLGWEAGRGCWAELRELELAVELDRCSDLPHPQL